MRRFRISECGFGYAEPVLPGSDLKLKSAISNPQSAILKIPEGYYTFRAYKIIISAILPEDIST
jgi:hypothetical protein